VLWDEFLRRLRRDGFYNLIQEGAINEDEDEDEDEILNDHFYFF